MVFQSPTARSGWWHPRGHQPLVYEGPYIVDKGRYSDDRVRDNIVQLDTDPGL